MNNVHCIQYTVYTVHYTLYTVHCTLYIIHCTLYTVNCTLYTDTVHCIVVSITLYYNTSIYIVKYELDTLDTMAHNFF